MDERVHFASLLFASHMGILGKSEVIEAADQRIVELEKPEYWLIELSTKGDSGELEGLVVSADENGIQKTPDSSFCCVDFTRYA